MSGKSVSSSLQRNASFAIACVLASLLGGCASVHNLPLNTPTSSPMPGFIRPAGAAEAIPARRISGDTVVGLAFSGGGTRAAAFAYGVLDRMAKYQIPREGPLLDHIGLVSGVSGGAIMAAYYGLKGPAALHDFRARYLTQDLMAQLDTSFSLGNIARAVGGGVNTDNKMRDWFNTNLFHGATFADLAGRRPVALINATDIYNRTPFLFSPQTFAAACSDFAQYPLAAAVAASAAVPGAFAPVVIEAYPDQCQTPLPGWVTAAAANPHASPLLQAYARGLTDIRSGRVKYVKLFDGGLIDNYGLSGITIIRAGQRTPYGPLSPEEAINMRRMMFLVVDAGQGPKGNWSSTLEGPAGRELVGAVVDVLVDANARTSYTAFEETMKAWRESIVKWRCGLKASEVAQLRGRSGPWNCRDLKFTIARVSFDQLGAERARVLNAVPTSFTLPADTIDTLTQAGGDALDANAAFQGFIRDM
ncbi:patatin-like phospholipase family protein [Undibacter mobilis]|uniref:Patatin-like phospholipase family protein n=2 Tax=Undibacter mobilis TaxID=2292256 RepID=A0A371BDS8_9BRAD|nr:patatin-like phospholipase family protein [Undibacter mobilis]